MSATLTATPTLEEFQAACERHDWTYCMSDYLETRHRGRDAEKALCEMARQLPAEVRDEAKQIAIKAAGFPGYRFEARVLEALSA